MIMGLIYLEKYINNKLKEIFTVPSVTFIAYKGIPKEVNFGWGNHYFWSLYYVDRGDRNIITEDNAYHLKTGQGMFFAPNQKHKTRDCTGKSSNIVNISFYCPTLDTEFFSNRIFTFNGNEKRILSDIINEGIQHYERVDNNPKYKGMRLRKDAPVYTTHLIRASLEYLLLSLYRKKNLSNQANYAVGGNRQNQVSMLIQSAIEFMHENVDKKLTLEDISNELNVSSSYLRALFKKETEKSVIDYFNEIKINKAKVLIFEDSYTLTEISEILGFCATSYFSELFKKKVNMSPTEYSKLVNPQLIILK